VLAWQLTNTTDLCLSLGHETLSLLKQLLQQQNTYFKYKAELDTICIHIKQQMPLKSQHLPAFLKVL